MRHSLWNRWLHTCGSATVREVRGSVSLLPEDHCNQQCLRSRRCQCQESCAIAAVSTGQHATDVGATPRSAQSGNDDAHTLLRSSFERAVVTLTLPQENT